MKVTWCSNLVEAAAKIGEGTAEAAVVVEPYHDNPPGDWYIQFKVICANTAIAERVAQARLPIDPKQPWDDPLVISGTYMTALCGRTVVRRENEETPKFLASWAPEVAVKATHIEAILSTA